jgi:hypothetical protein
MAPLRLSQRCTVFAVSVTVQLLVGKNYKRLMTWEHYQNFVLFGKSALECCKSLKESLGGHAPSYDTVQWWVNAIKNDWEETVKPQHWQQTNATWNKWNLSLNVHAVFHAWQLLQKSESLQPVFTISSPTASENEKVVQSTCTQQLPKTRGCSSCHHPSAAL